MIRSIVAELRKTTSTRLWIGLAAGGAFVAGLSAVVVFIVAGTREGVAAGLTPIRTTEDVELVVFGGAVMSAFALVLGATTATAEHRYGTAAITALATPSRARALTAKMIAASPIGFALGLLGGVISLVIALVVFAVRGDPFPFGRVLLLDVVFVGIQCAYVASLAAGVGQAIRSQLVAILGLLGWLFIVEPLAASLAEDVARWSPFSGAQNAFGLPADALVSKAVGAGLMVAYLVTAWSVAWWLERRRDV